MKSNLPLKQYKNILFPLIGLVIFLLVGFLIGLHLHGSFSQWIYDGKIKVNKFMCFGHSNLLETYQWDCYMPKPKSIATFKLSNNLSCKYIQGIGLNEDSYSEATKKYLSTLSFKNNSVEFTININPANKTLMRSNTGGEVAQGKFQIERDDENIIIALRKTFLEEGINLMDYEQIFLSKRTGKGIINHYNGPDPLRNMDSIDTSFILCK